jgi:peptide/nickel transport system substrate-binding protein
MMIRTFRLAAAVAVLAAIAGCKQPASGPVVVSAIGRPPQLTNPNLEPLDSPSALLVEAVGQGLLRFDPSGQVEPALAQSWIVSNDGLRYTFRLARIKWASGGSVTAEQVVVRLRAAISRSSKNPLKPLLGAIAEIEAMTDNVLEISLKGPRPNFLQLLAQPELAILRDSRGTGPLQAEPQADGSMLLTPRNEEDEAAVEDRGSAGIILRGEGAAVAVARYQRRLADLVTGGTVGDLPIARAIEPPAAALRFDPVAGLFGLAFARSGDVLADPALRSALSMAVDREALVAALGVPDLQPRASLLPTAIDELPDPALPDWAASPLAERRELAAGTVRGIIGDAPFTLRVAVPEGPGYRLVFAHLRRDWRAIGVTAQAVKATEEADLRLVDRVAAANISTWYLRHFTCDSSMICSPEADAMLEGARNAAAFPERQALLASADRALTDLTPFIPLTAPVRWSLVSPRLTGFQPNAFGRHFLGGLVTARR